jgi:hypothetical protein
VCAIDDETMIPDIDCVPYEEFLLLPEDLERLLEARELRKKLDPNMSIPAFSIKNVDSPY